MAHSRRPQHGEPETQATRSDWYALVASVRENPWAYLGGLLFVIAVIVIVVIFRQVSERQVRKENSALAQALSEEDPTLRLDRLTKLAASDSVTDEAVYMLGETAFDAQNYDQARQAFERVRDQYPQSQYVPTAVEGLADIAFESGDYDAALQRYQEIRDRWPTSFAARRQPLNIGRTYEKLNRPEDAITAYQEQVTAFAGSVTASMAEQALDRLRGSHPELFPEEAPATPAVESSEAAPPIGILPPEGIAPVEIVPGPEATPEPIVTPEPTAEPLAETPADAVPNEEPAPDSTEAPVDVAPSEETDEASVDAAAPEETVVPAE